MNWRAVANMCVAFPSLALQWKYHIHNSILCVDWNGKQIRYHKVFWFLFFIRKISSNEKLLIVSNFFVIFQYIVSEAQTIILWYDSIRLNDLFVMIERKNKYEIHMWKNGITMTKRKTTVTIVFVWWNLSHKMS